MLVKPWFQDTILAGPTKVLARERFVLNVQLNPYCRYDLLAVRFPPGVCVSEYRYLAAVTWVPVR